MRRISVRRRDVGSFEVGPAGHGPTVMVSGRDRREALKRGKKTLREKGLLGAAADLSFRDNLRNKTRPAMVAAR